jgi:hypothetical protein
MEKPDFEEPTDIETQEVADLFDPIQESLDAAKAQFLQGLQERLDAAKAQFLQGLQERLNCFWVSTITFKKAPRGEYGPKTVEQDIKSFEALDSTSVQKVYARGRTFLVHFGNTLSTTSEEDEEQYVNELVAYLEIHDKYNDELPVESTCTFYVSQGAMPFMFNE